MPARTLTIEGAVALKCRRTATRWDWEPFSAGAVESLGGAGYRRTDYWPPAPDDEPYEGAVAAAGFEVYAALAFPLPAMPELLAAQSDGTVRRTAGVSGRLEVAATAVYPPLAPGQNHGDHQIRFEAFDNAALTWTQGRFPSGSTVSWIGITETDPYASAKLVADPAAYPGDGQPFATHCACWKPESSWSTTYFPDGWISADSDLFLTSRLAVGAPLRLYQMLGAVRYVGATADLLHASATTWLPYDAGFSTGYFVPGAARLVVTITPFADDTASGGATSGTGYTLLCLDTHEETGITAALLRSNAYSAVGADFRDLVVATNRGIAGDGAWTGFVAAQAPRDADAAIAFLPSGRLVLSVAASYPGYPARQWWYNDRFGDTAAWYPGSGAGPALWLSARRGQGRVGDLLIATE